MYSTQNKVSNICIYPRPAMYRDPKILIKTRGFVLSSQKLQTCFKMNNSRFDLSSSVRSRVPDVSAVVCDIYHFSWKHSSHRYKFASKFWQSQILFWHFPRSLNRDPYVNVTKMGCIKQWKKKCLSCAKVICWPYISRKTGIYAYTQTIPDTWLSDTGIETSVLN
jgi:hypothetical protein